MTGVDLVFSSVMFCYFLDRGPSSIDFFFPGEMKEDPDLTAVRLMTKSTAMVKGDSSQQVEQSITEQLSGPDIYPVDPHYRMVWYNWLIANRFSNDPRIRNTGGMAGIYCIYEKKNEEIIRNSLKIIEQILRSISLEFKTIDDIIKKKFSLSASTSINQDYFSDFIKEKDSDIITKSISSILNEKVKKFSEDRRRKYISQTAKFKIILQNMVFKKGTPEEIYGQSEKRNHWHSMIKTLDSQIQAKIPNMVLKKLNEENLGEIYHLLAKEKIWAELPMGEIHSSIQITDIGNFFFYYWLAHHQLLKRKNILKFYRNIMK